MSSGSVDAEHLDGRPPSPDAARKHGEGSPGQPHHAAVSFAQNDMAVENAEQDDQVRAPRPALAHKPSFAGNKTQSGVLVQKKSLAKADSEAIRGLFHPGQIAAFFDLIKAGEYEEIR